MTLTDTDRKLYRFMSDYQQEHKYSPSVREMANALGKHYTTIHNHLRHLEQHGQIFHPPGVVHGWRVKLAEDEGKLTIDDTNARMLDDLRDLLTMCEAQLPPTTSARLIEAWEGAPAKLARLRQVYGE